MKSNFYTEEELNKMGFKSVGQNVFISRKCSIYGAENMSIGHHVRIDDFCILSGSITIGNYVHIAAYTALYGRYGIEIGNFCGISARGLIYSAVDDFSGEHMISPMVPDNLICLKTGKVVLENFVQLGCATVVLPGTTLHEGSATGAMTFVKTDIPSWSIFAGVPAKKIKDRRKEILNLANQIK